MSSEQRAALAKRIGDDVEVGTAEAWRVSTGQALSYRDRMIVRQSLDVALAAVEAAGWGPRPEPVTLEEQGRLIAKLSATPGVRGGKLAVNAVLTSDVLRSRGITVEGEK